MNRSVAPFSRNLQGSTDYGAINSAPLESLLSVVWQQCDVLHYASILITHGMWHRQVFRGICSVLKGSNRHFCMHTISRPSSNHAVLHMQVSQSHDLLAEILQLSSTLPAALQSPGCKFAPILFDFRFFRDPDAHERKVEASQELTDLDEEFREVRNSLSC